MGEDSNQTSNIFGTGVVRWSYGVKVVAGGVDAAGFQATG